MKEKAYSIFVLFLLVVLCARFTNAQCFLKSSTSYNADNKITAQITNTYVGKFNLKERQQNGGGLYQSNAFLEYDAQNKLVSTAYKNGDKTIKTANAQANKEEKTNQIGQKSVDEFSQNGNSTVKTSKDAQGNINRVESNIFEGGKLVSSETQNAQNQIVSRETFTYNAENNILKSTVFDAILDQTKNINNVYNSDNKLTKSEILINNIRQSTSFFSYTKDKLTRKETQDASGQIAYYQIFEYSKNSSIESNFYRGVLHSKIITTFDNKNNPVEIEVFNEKQKLTQKTINTYICK